METLAPGVRVAYLGQCHTVRKVVDAENVVLYPLRGRFVVTVNRKHLSEWQPKPKQSAHAKTCQICGRAIHAATGAIAHHGYTRPLPGFQTASCWGAKHMPFEASRDTLTAYLLMVRERLMFARSSITDMRRNPGAIHRLEAKREGGRYGARVLDSDGRSVQVLITYNPGDAGYAGVWRARLQELQSEFAQLRNEYRHQLARHKSWRGGQ